MLDTAPSHGRYTLRPVTEGDFDFLWDLKVATLKPYIEQIYVWDELQAQDILRRKVMVGAHIVQVQGEPVGVLKVDIVEGFVYLAEIGLMPQHQNKGLGTCIIKDVLAVADRHGMPTELQVFAINPAAKLYERLGFSVTHQKMYRPVPGSGK